MATAQRPEAPEIKSVHRVANIPIVHDGLAVIHDTLTAWTPTAYAYGQAFGTTAYNYSQPIQARLAPLIVSADGYAIKGLDAAQTRFPTPFVIKTEEVVEQIKASREQAYTAITSPVYDFAHNVDSSLSPLINRFETAVNKLHGSDPAEDSASSSSSDSTVDETQVKRAYRLGVDLKDQILILSTEQIKQLQGQSVVIQRAQESVKNLNTNLSTSYSSAKGKSAEIVAETKASVEKLSQNIFAELEKAQAITKSLPAQIQTSLQPVQEGIQASLTEISNIIKSEAPAGEKVAKVSSAVQENIQPLLHQATVTLQEYIEQGKAYLKGAKAKAAETADAAEEEAPAPLANGSH